MTAYADSQSADVRLAVAKALIDLVGRGRRGIPLLLRLSADESPEVRNWASTGLRASVEVFGHRDPDILDALAARLQDPDDEVRGEAILGLAAAGDSRARVALTGAAADRVGDLYLDHARHYLDDPNF